ncbi:ficolin-2-like [Drosophila innubila]|uniref:ficolin-2-like n=1 Tax=Drosophila innubila TaxID=198719 RepID=UPI00148CBABC|nr:ficolin-2-like [Drosophila innubila]XP_034474178.1 ficolin-2-like [Drosophila innubila]
MDGEFFLGLDKINALTLKSQKLLVVVEDFDGNNTYELYDKFAIGSEDEQYILHTLGSASGTAGDSLRRQQGMKFTTFDQDNDTYEAKNCAVRFPGPWWYANCHDSHLAGVYNNNKFGVGVNWDTFRGPNYSLKRAEMMIRPRD